MTFRTNICKRTEDKFNNGSQLVLLTIRIYSSEKYRAIINYLILADIASREMQSMQELVFYFTKTQCIDRNFGWPIFFYPSFVF